MDAADRTSLIAWADKIDSRVGPISGRDADAIAVLFRRLAAEAASPAAGWLPIRTAKRDNEALLFFPSVQKEADKIEIGRPSDYDSGWRKPTRWMPIPPAPSEEARAG